MATEPGFLAPRASLLTVKDVAERLNVSADSVRRWARTGVGPQPVRLGQRAIRYRPEDVDAWVERGGAA